MPRRSRKARASAINGFKKRGTTKAKVDGPRALTFIGGSLQMEVEYVEDEVDNNVCESCEDDTSLDKGKIGIEHIEDSTIESEFSRVDVPSEKSIHQEDSDRDFVDDEHNMVCCDDKLDTRSGESHVRYGSSTHIVSHESQDIQGCVNSNMEEFHEVKIEPSSPEMHIQNQTIAENIDNLVDKRYVSDMIDSLFVNHTDPSDEDHVITSEELSQTYRNEEKNNVVKLLGTDSSSNFDGVISTQSEVHQNIQYTYNQSQTNECRTCFLVFRNKAELIQHAQQYLEQDLGINENDLWIDDPITFRKVVSLKKYSKMVHNKMIQNTEVELDRNQGKMKKVIHNKEVELDTNQWKVKKKFRMKKHATSVSRCHKKTTLRPAYTKSGQLKSKICRYCGKRFARKSWLQKHSVIHKGEKLPVKKTRKKSLKSYACEYCGKEFAAQSLLRKHHLLHTGEKPEICDKCGKCFRTRDILTVHMQTHTRERKHECDICQKRFKRHWSLTDHKRKRHGPPKKKKVPTATLR